MLRRSRPATPVEVILNAHSGSAKDDSRARIEAAFERAGVEVQVHAVAADRLTHTAARAAAAGRTVVAAGGDGTVSAVASAAAEAGVPLGVIPLGTLNHFAKDTGIPLDIDAAVRTIAGGAITPLDAAEINGRTFVNNASAGIYGRVVRERQLEQRRGHAKWTAFAIGLARAWRDYRPIRIRITADGDARVMTTPFVFVGNGSYVTEGPGIGGRTSLATGKLSVYVAPECTRAEMFSMFVRALAGRLAPDVALEALTATELTIESGAPQHPLAVDGELVGARWPLQCRVRPGVLATLRPAEAAA